MLTKLTTFVLAAFMAVASVATAQSRNMTLLPQHELMGCKLDCICVQAEGCPCCKSIWDFVLEQFPGSADGSSINHEDETLSLRATGSQFRLVDNQANSLIMNYHIDPNYVIHYSAKVNDNQHDWTVQYDPNRENVAFPSRVDEAAFADFAADASRSLYETPAGLFLVQTGHDRDTADVDDDDGDGDAFCGALGAITGAANPVAGVGIYLLCDFLNDDDTLD